MEEAMSATGLTVFDKTLQSTHIWLDEIMEAIGPTRDDAWTVLGVVLRALRDRLPVTLGAHLSAQLPLLLRGAYYDQWRPSEDKLKKRSLTEFLDEISDGLAGRRPIGPADAARAVFAVLNHHIDPGQALNVFRSLPEDIRALWPESIRALAAEDL
jgi:uncharacterized protein (DUF2267 family)